MIVFKKYLKILWANKTFLFPFLIFLALTTYFNHQTPSQDSSSQISQFTYGIVDLDHSTLSKDLTDFIKNKSILKPISQNPRDIKDALFYREVDSVLVIPKGFEKDFGSGTAKIQRYSSPNAWAGFFLNMNINNYLNTRKLYIEKFPQDDQQEISHMLKTDLNVSTPVVYQTNKKEGDFLHQYSYYTRYIGFLLLMQLLNGIALTSSAFNETKIKQRIMCSSYPDRKRNRQLLLGHSVIALIILALPFCTAFIYYPAQIIFSTQGLLMMLRVCFHTLTILALAGVITALSGNSERLNIIINAISLPLCFLGGLFVPLEVMGKSILQFSQFLPQYWLVKGIQSVSTPILTVQSYHQYWHSIGIESIILVALTLLAIGINRQKRMLKL